MARGKGRGHQPRKKDKRRERRQGSPVVSAPVAQPAAPTKTGYESTRAPVSSAFRSWATDYSRRQAGAMTAQMAESGQELAPDAFMLVPLTTRTVAAPGGEMISVQMGIPLRPSAGGRVTPASDRLAVVVLRLPDTDMQGAMAALGLGQAPNMPQPEAVFAVQVPGMQMRSVRPADALAWHLARLIAAGDMEPEPRRLAQAAAEALTLLQPSAAPPGVPRLDPAGFDAYGGYGDGADTEAVPPDITTAPARGGLPGLPRGAFLEDNGAPLAPLLADLRDYVIGLWPFEYFGLEALTDEPELADGPARADVLARLADVTRRLDGVLAQTSEDEEAVLAAEGRPPAWIAEETARYREMRQTLRSTRVAQELIPRLGPILFDLEVPPDDYEPAMLDEADDREEEE